MRRVILLFSILLFAISGWSQSVTINFKNGQTTKYSMNDINSIVFETENDGDSSNNDIVGVWEVTSVECNYSVESAIGDRMYLNADGSYRDPQNSGQWVLNGKYLTTTCNGVNTVFEVISLTKTQLILRYLNNDISLTIYFKRVGTDGSGDDNGNVTPISGDYIRVTLNGKTYSANILDWHYAQIDPVGRDSNNKPLTLTYDMCDHFDSYGFSFMFGVVHFSRKNELLASSPGTYGCSKDILSDDYYRNLTFCSTLDIDYDEYNWVSGTHQVKSIKEVSGKVQLEGSFTSTFELNGNSKTVKGDYRITIP